MPVAIHPIKSVSTTLCWAVLCIGMTAACAEPKPGTGPGTETDSGTDVEAQYDSTEPGTAKLQHNDGEIVAETTVTGGFNDAGVHIGGQEAGVSFTLSHPTPEIGNATNGDSDFQLPFTLRLADGTELTAADAIFFRWAVYDRGYEGYAYIAEGPLNLIVVIGSDELITHSCTADGTPLCEETTSPHHRMDIEELTSQCSGTFAEALPRNPIPVDPSARRAEGPEGVSPVLGQRIQIVLNPLLHVLDFLLIEAQLGVRFLIRRRDDGIVELLLQLEERIQLVLVDLRLRDCRVGLHRVQQIGVRHHLDGLVAPSVRCLDHCRIVRMIHSKVRVTGENVAEGHLKLRLRGRARGRQRENGLDERSDVRRSRLQCIGILPIRSRQHNGILSGTDGGVHDRVQRAQTELLRELGEGEKIAVLPLDETRGVRSQVLYTLLLRVRESLLSGFDRLLNGISHCLTLLDLFFKARCMTHFVFPLD